MHSTGRRAVTRGGCDRSARVRPRGSLRLVWLGCATSADCAACMLRRQQDEEGARGTGVAVRLRDSARSGVTVH